MKWGKEIIYSFNCRPEDTDMDRFSKRQAVVLICATNRPEELHDSFVRPGRIDREIHIGLPGEQGRLGIFSVHSAGRRLSKDVNFGQVCLHVTKDCFASLALVKLQLIFLPNV